MNRKEEIKGLLEDVGFRCPTGSFNFKDIEEELSELSDKDITRMKNIIAYNEDNNEKKVIKFTYYTEFKPAERPRAAPVFDKSTKQFKGIRVYDPTTNKESKVDFRESMLYFVKNEGLLETDEDGRVMLIKGNFSMYINMYKKIPESFSKAELVLAELGYIRPDTKPDTDNIGKNILDALSRYIYSDDKNNDTLLIRKLYSVVPRLEVTILYRNSKVKTKNIKL